MERIQFHGKRRRTSFFEGWYLKYQGKKDTIAFIPAFHEDKYGKRFATLQVITGDGAWFLWYPAEEFQADTRKFRVRVGDSVFSEHGALLDIAKKSLRIQGELHHSPWAAPKWDIMGPFRYVPFMQCNHGVLSMTHRVTGKIRLNGCDLFLDDGCGYVEKDWGRSFPGGYFWTQCNWFQERDISVMLSVADIPVGPVSFTGCIAFVYCRGEVYRMATYLGARVISLNPKEVIISQGRMVLRVELLEEGGYGLKAPVSGAMSRVIREHPQCRVRYGFWANGRNILQEESDRASYEWAMEEPVGI